MPAIVTAILWQASFRLVKQNRDNYGSIAHSLLLPVPAGSCLFLLTISRAYLYLTTRGLIASFSSISK